MRQRKARVRAATTAAAVLILQFGCSTGDKPATKNVLLLTLDTTRADRIGAFGGKAVPTPHLDELAHEGVIFSTAISQVPLTLPAHSSIHTGRYPAAHGVRHNGLYRLPDTEITLAERLQAEGFRTAAFVGAFVLNRQFGLAQGFEIYDDLGDATEQAGADPGEAQRSADDVNERFLAWLDERPPGKWFAWLHYYDPHIPYAPPEKPGRRLDGAGYDREISYIDHCIGDLVARLDRDGLLDETLLVVVGDHGESLGEHRELTHGIFLYESALRVPFLIRGGPDVPEGKTIAEPVELVDVAPTILDLVGAPPISADGRSLVPRMTTNAKAQARFVHAETFMPRIEFGWSELLMVRNERYKYIQAPRPELYDLEQDPGEERNLIDTEAARARRMADALQAWLVAAVAVQTDAAENELTPDEEARLRSLGYLGGGRFATDGAGSLPDPKDRIEEGRLITLARDMTSADNAEEALRIIDDVLAASPNNHLAHTSRIQALMRLGRLKDAETAAARAVAAALNDATASPMLEEQARRAHASTLWLIGRNAEAVAEYEAAEAINQLANSAPVFGGLLLGAAGGQQEAGRIVERALAENPVDPLAWAARFELQFSARDFAAALETSRRLATLAAGDPDTLVRAGELALGSGEPELALRLFETALSKAPESAEVLGYVGTTRTNLGDLAGARAALVKVLELQPDEWRAHFYLGNVALLENHEQEARAHYTAALGLNPELAPARINLARWLAENGRMPEAIEELETALRQQSADENVRQLLAQFRADPGPGSAEEAP